MKITRKRYEKAKSIISDAKKQIEICKKWEEATKQTGLNLESITVNEDGTITAECVVDSKAGSGKATTEPERRVPDDSERRT